MFGVVELPTVISSNSEYMGAERVRVGSIDGYGTVPGFLDEEYIGF
jgi:hypothetical protein